MYRRRHFRYLSLNSRGVTWSYGVQPSLQMQPMEEDSLPFGANLPLIFRVFLIAATAFVFREAIIINSPQPNLWKNIPIKTNGTCEVTTKPKPAAATVPPNKVGISIPGRTEGSKNAHRPGPGPFFHPVFFGATTTSKTTCGRKKTTTQPPGICDSWMLGKII